MDYKALISITKELCVLYVEDDPSARELSSMIFEEFFGKLDAVESPMEGLELLQKNHYDLIITDITMPEMDGLAFAQKIKEYNENIKVIVLSAHNDTDYFLKSIQIGVDGYIIKPIEMNQFINTIAKVAQEIQLKKELAQTLQLLRLYQEATDKVSLVSKTDTKGVITYVNELFCKTSGYTKEELLGKPHNIVRHPDNPKELYERMWHTIKEQKKPFQEVIRNRTKDGKAYYVDSFIMPLLNEEGEVKEYISIRHDITNIMDPHKQLQWELEHAKKPVFIYMKLANYDQLEEFYDTKTLQKIQERSYEYLKSLFSDHFEYEKFYALGKGEYALLITAGKMQKEQCIAYLQNLQQSIKDKVIEVEDFEYNIEVIMGVGFEKEKMLESAQLAIKKMVKENISFMVFDYLAQEEKKRATKNLQTIQMIKRALQEARIVSFFQPIIDNKTLEVVKYESLVRIVENDKVLSPFFFLETAKKSNYYFKITKTVIEQSFILLKNFKDKELSINLSVIDIEQPWVREFITQKIYQAKEDAKRVVFELLEDEAVSDFDVVKEFIKEVKSKGVKIAIDDFGSGYSNYERLLAYEPDILKIDGSLIKNIEHDQVSKSAVKSIITFAKEQNLQTVAEFIENEKIFSIIRDLGVDFSQGYYFGKPERLL